MWCLWVVIYQMSVPSTKIDISDRVIDAITVYNMLKDVSASIFTLCGLSLWLDNLDDWIDSCYDC